MSKTYDYVIVIKNNYGAIDIGNLPSISFLRLICPQTRRELLARPNLGPTFIPTLSCYVTKLESIEGPLKNLCLRAACSLEQRASRHETFHLCSAYKALRLSRSGFTLGENEL